MQQDQRIGLALAVLLLGAAGAFFFRNDPKPAETSPRLRSARELDARIAEKSISPYLESADEDHETGTKARKVSDRTSDGSLPSLDPPDFFPETSMDKEGVQELSPIPFPDAIGSEPPTRTVPSTSSGERVHIVQKGETLSSIAAKELGSSNRFQEIYQANRDQLNDANDVRVGMTLKIPSRRNAGSEPVTAKGKSNAAPPLIPSESNQIGELPINPGETSSTSAKKKFEPVKRPPTGVKGMGSQSSETDPPAKPARKLSQTPPRDGRGAY